MLEQLFNSRYRFVFQNFIDTLSDEMLFIKKEIYFYTKVFYPF